MKEDIVDDNFLEIFVNQEILNQIYKWEMSR
jgi:hypothetical protein